MTADAPASTEGAKWFERAELSRHAERREAPLLALPLADGDDASGRQREPQALARQAHTAALSVSYPTTESAALVEASLRPEVGRLDDDRAAASVRREAEEVVITVEAADLVALRAGAASWSRLLAVAERVAGVEA